MDIRAEQAHQLADIRRVENGDGINILQCRQDFSALLLFDSRAALAFQPAHAGIRIHGDNQFAAKLFGRAKIADMADVKQVKAAVGEDDFLSGGAPGADLFGEFTGS